VLAEDSALGFGWRSLASAYDSSFLRRSWYGFMRGGRAK
jgi:hypothetical protein